MSRLSNFDTASLTALHWAAFALAITSGVIHLVLIVAWDIPPTSTFGILFFLAFGGYLGGVALVAINYRRKLLYILGVPYTGSQIVMWYLANQPAGVADISVFEWIDKIAQLLLLVVLVILYLEED